MTRMSVAYSLVLAAAACLSSSALAQNAPEWSHKKFSLEFPGGRLDEFIEHLQAQTPELNVVVAEDVQSVHVQSFRLQNVTVVDVLDTLDELLEPQIEIGPVSGRLESTTPIILIAGNPARQRTAAFSTRSIIVKDGAPTVLEAIEFAIESLPDNDRRPSPKVRTHEATGIMIVTADEEQLRIISQVVELLGGESRLSFGAASGDPYGSSGSSLFGSASSTGRPSQMETSSEGMPNFSEKRAIESVLRGKR